MINPFLNMTIKGAIWYQGEANAGITRDYISYYDNEKCLPSAITMQLRYRYYDIAIMSIYR